MKEPGRPPTLRITLITAVSFAGYFALFQSFTLIMNMVDGLLGYQLASYVLTWTLAGIPLVAGAVLIHGWKGSIPSFGIAGNPLQGLLISALFVLPMMAGGWLLYPVNGELTLNRLLASTLLAAFFEEVYFRGFLFGQLFRYTRLGFIPAVITGALLFASGHLYQSHDVGVLAGIFATTFMGAVFFAWLYAEWDYNLWVPIFLHTFMNLAWTVFRVSDNALGDGMANVFRATTIALAITGTILWKRRKGRPLIINRSTLLVRKIT